MKKIIDVETLEVWDSLTDCAEALSVSSPYLLKAMELKYRVGGGYGAKANKTGRLLEYYSFWKEAYSAKEKAYLCQDKRFDFMEIKRGV